jgi:hypothetical protein
MMFNEHQSKDQINHVESKLPQLKLQETEKSNNNNYAEKIA